MGREQQRRRVNPGFLLAILLALPLLWFACLSDAPDLRGFPCATDSACGDLRCLGGVCGGGEASIEPPADAFPDARPPEAPDTPDAPETLEIPETPDAPELPPEQISGLCQPDHPLPLPSNCEKRKRLFAITAPHKGLITAMAYHEGRQLLLTAAVVAGAGRLILWSVRSNGTLALKYGPFEGHPSSIRSLAWFPDGKAFVLSSTDDFVHVWRENEKGLFVYDNKPISAAKGGVHELAFRTFSQKVVLFGLTITEGFLLMWDMGKALVPTATIPEDPKTDKARYSRFALNEDGSRIALVLKTPPDITISDFDAGALKRGKTLHTLKQPSGVVSAMAFGVGKASNWFASGGLSNKINIWDLGLSDLEPQLLYSTHTGAITKLRFAPENAFLISAGNDGTVRFFGLRKSSPDELRVLTPHKGIVIDFLLQNKGKHLTSISIDNSIMTYDLDTGALLYGLNAPHSFTYRMAMHPGGEEVVVFDGAVKLWSMRTGQMLLRRAPEKSTDVYLHGAYSPDGQRLALVRMTAPATFAVEIRSAADHALEYMWTPNTRPAGTNTPMTAINAIAWTPDSKQLLIGGVASAGARLLTLDVASQTSAALDALAENIRDMELSPDGQRLIVAHVVGGAIIIRLWDWQAATPVAKASTARLANVTGMALSPDGKRLIVGQTNVGVLSFQVTAEALVPQDTIPWEGSAPMAFAFHPDGERFAVGDGLGRIGLWNPAVSTFAFLAGGHQKTVRGLIWSLDGLHLISGDIALQLFAWHCPCKPGEKSRCFTGPAARRCIGRCREGLQTCTALPDNPNEGGWGTCTSQVLPQPAKAGSGEDMDCDGTLDP